MSVYAINKLLYRVEREEAYRKRIHANLDNVLSEVSLSEEEREALTSGDLHKLFKMGVHPFLLNHMPRHGLFGVTRQNYLPRIRGQESPSD
jgi:hypothetical protein